MASPDAPAGLGEIGFRRCVAEFVGTFLLVFAGPGAVVINEVSGGGVGSLGIGLSFGLAVMAAIYAVGHISGAHINPAVTVAFALTRQFPWSLVPAYVLSQLLGACAASAVHLALFGNVANLGATVPSGSPLQALGLELLLTLFLMFVISSVATDVRAVGQAAAIAIGGYVALAATFARPIAGASMNPARSFGPALLSDTWTAQWVFLGRSHCGGCARVPSLPLRAGGESAQARQQERLSLGPSKPQCFLGLG